MTSGSAGFVSTGLRGCYLGQAYDGLRCLCAYARRNSAKAHKIRNEVSYSRKRMRSF